MNFVVMPIIHLFFPETARRSLEEIDLIFVNNSLLVRKNMVEHDQLVAEAGGNVAVAARKLLDEVNGETHLDPRRVSIGGEDGLVKSSSDMDHMEVSLEKSNSF